ncbi:MAG: porin family protein [Bradyrhizobiaceae bacterium]|nr:MAG: porin family protein [Bradyrhizobiaceae bacterium]
MRKAAILVTAVFGVGLSHAAFAADLPAKVYTKAPPPPVTYGWTGSYVGGYIGGAFNDGNVTTTAPGDVATYSPGSSFIGGLTSGYNYQFAPNWLIGYESETGYLQYKAHGNFAGSGGAVYTHSDSWYSSWAGRFGYVSGPSLFYAKGGVTLSRFDSTATPAGITYDHQRYEIGYAVGGGWEYMLNNMWSVKAEYLYLGFGDKLSAGPTNTDLAGVHTVKVGMNYKWDPLSLLFH